MATVKPSRSLPKISVNETSGREIVQPALFMFDVQCTKEVQCEGGGKSSYLVELLLEELLLRLKRRKSS